MKPNWNAIGSAPRLRRIDTPRRAPWRDAATLRQAQLSPALRAWLLDPGSLTRRLKNLSRGQFAVRVLAQTWTRPNVDERRLLGVGSARRARVRQVLLECQGQHWVYARTVMPVTSLRGSLRALLFLGRRPLGELLFRRPGTRRTRVQVKHARLDKLANGVAPREPVWGRRAVFMISGKPILVSEFFLPDMTAALAGPRRRGVAQAVTQTLGRKLPVSGR